MHLGIIISSPEGPSTTEFSFAIDPKVDVKKGHFVQVKTLSGILMGMVSEIMRLNRYFERPDTIVAYSKDTRISDHFPTAEWEYLVAQVRILGTYTYSNRFARTFSPPAPGDSVVLADSSLLGSFLGFSNQGLHIGSIQHHDVEARLDLTRALQKHMAILAMSGAGKSHLCSVLMEELMSRTPEEGRVAVIVVDIHGEYVGFAEDPLFKKHCTVFDGSKLCVPLQMVSPEQLEVFLPYLSGPQKALLSDAFIRLKKEEKRKSFGFKELVEAINVSTLAKDDTKKTLLRSINELRRYRFLSTSKLNPRFSELKPGALWVLDFSTLDSIRRKQMIVALLAQRLYNLRKKQKIPPFLLVIEEAHNFARERAEEHEAIARSIIETIAREGRKFGASLCLISQRPVNLSTTALSQCNTHIILRVTNPNDLDHIQSSSEGIDARVAKTITSLRTGECIIVGEAVNYPIFVSVRNRKSIRKERSKPLVDQAKDFEAKMKRQEDGVEAFL